MTTALQRAQAESFGHLLFTAARLLEILSNEKGTLSSLLADMPVTVAVDAQGISVHNTGPKEWQAKIGKIPVTVA